MTFLQGVDVSHWQGNWNPQTAYNAGARFAFIKSSDANSNGAPWTDDQFVANARKCTGVMPWGPYHWWKPSADPVAQGAYWANLVKGFDFTLPAMLDVEDATNLFSSYTAADKIYALLCAFQAVLPGVKMGIYTRLGTYWNDRIVNGVHYSIATRSYWKDYDLWVARYPYDLGTKTSPWWDGLANYSPRPGEWDTWDFWQYSADGNGKGAMYGAESASIDLDIFNGDQAKFNSIYGEVIPPLPPEVAMTLIEKVTASLAKSAVYPNNYARLIVPAGKTWKVRHVAAFVSKGCTKISIIVRAPSPDTDTKWAVITDIHGPDENLWISLPVELDLDAGFIVEAQVTGVDDMGAVTLAIAGTST